MFAILEGKEMSHEDAVNKGLRLVPMWWPIAIGICTALMTTGATWGSLTGQIARQSEQIQQITSDRQDTLREWGQWRRDVDRWVTTSQNNQEFIRDSLAEIKETLRDKKK